MTDETRASLETPSDAGKGASGVHRRWMLAIDLASREEEKWREEAAKVVEAYRDERDYRPRERHGASRFNILWANTELLRPSLYSNTPRPDVRRRYRDPDPIGKEVAEVIERCLSYSVDAYDFDHVIDTAVVDYLLPGRAVTRVRYIPSMSGDEVAWESVECEPVPWRRFRRGPGLCWSDVPWIAFEHLLTRDELRERFGAAGKDVPLDVEVKGTSDKEDESSIFKRGRVWEIWDKDAREVLYIAPERKDGPLKVESDPLRLKGFFPVPRPLYSVETSDSLVPIAEYRLYRDQAEELDQITHRIRRIVSAIRARGIYDATLSEMSRLLEGDDNELVPSEGAQHVLASTQTLDRHVWMLPVEHYARVLASLYQQREAIKQTIYEITGLSDILRGATDANETLGAQQLKAQTGSLRLQRRQREVQRYVRDILEIKAEIMAEHFSPETLSAMSAKQVTAEGLQLARTQGLRDFRIDIETDSTIAADQQADAENIAKLLGGMTDFITGIGPAVQSGMFPKDAAASMLVAAVRRFKFGREVEDKLDQLQGDGQSGQAEALRAQLMPQLQQEAMAQAEQSVASEKQQLEMAKAQLAQERQSVQVAAQSAQKENDLRSREVQLQQREAEMAIAQRVADLEKRQFALEALHGNVQGLIGEAEAKTGENDARESRIDDVEANMQELAKAIAMLAEALASGQRQTQDGQQAIIAALSAPVELVRDSQGRPTAARRRLDS